MELAIEYVRGELSPQPEYQVAFDSGDGPDTAAMILVRKLDGKVLVLDLWHMRDRRTQNSVRFPQQRARTR